MPARARPHPTNLPLSHACATLVGNEHGNDATPKDVANMSNFRTTSFCVILRKVMGVRGIQRGHEVVLALRTLTTFTLPRESATFRRRWQRQRVRRRLQDASESTSETRVVAVRDAAGARRFTRLWHLRGTRQPCTAASKMRLPASQNDPGLALRTRSRLAPIVQARSSFY